MDTNSTDIAEEKKTSKLTLIPDIGKLRIILGAKVSRGVIAPRQRTKRKRLRKQAHEARRRNR